MQDITLLSTEILECQLSEDSVEVAVTIAGYVAKKLKKRFGCQICDQKMVSTDYKMFFIMNILKYYPEVDLYAQANLCLILFVIFLVFF